MRRMLAPVLALCSLVTSVSASRAQSGPDNDADGAPGYVRSVFDHGPIDSINLYNGQLTVPIPIGPSYPIGPRLRLQLALNYSSRVDEYGSPAASQQSPDFFYKPLVGNPSLAIGWELTLGAIKRCKHGATWSDCYFGPDGSQHSFNAARGNGWVTSDGSQLFLTGAGPFDMWDGDGNHYSFDQQVSGAGVTGTHDFGIARDGWYLSSVADPFGNSYSVSYYTGLNPCWTYGASTCAANVTTSMKMLCASPTGGWVPRDVTLPSGSKIHVNTGPVNGVADMITSVDFPVFVDGAAATRTWALKYAATPESYGKYCGFTSGGGPAWLSVNLQELASLDMPADDSGTAPKYQFTYIKGLLGKVTLPTQGSIAYCWATWNFHHGRSGAQKNGCPSLAPPSTASILVPYVGTFCGGSLPEDLAPDIPPGDCVEDNELRWTDTQIGVVSRTETVGSSINVTDYKQYALPRGESGAGEPQTLTIVVLPATDKNGAADPGRRRAKALLFTSSPQLLGPWPAQSKSSAPGDRVGADVEERVFETEPSQADLSEPLCPGTAADKPFCSSKALRVIQNTYEYDNASDKTGNRRLQTEKTIYGGGTCGTCPYHQVAYSLSSGKTWDGNGRHYNVETHGGTLGGDSRVITTDWAPLNWTSGPPAGNPVLPNLMNSRETKQGSSVKTEYFEFDATSSPPTGFLKGTLVFDPGTYGSPGNAFTTIGFLNCRYNDGAGDVDKEFTATYPGLGSPPATPCATAYPTLPDPFPNNSDAFAKGYTWQNGELLAARWIKGPVGSPTFKFKDSSRDTTTGWVTSSRDTSGRQTSYTYDSLGRVRQITPPSASDLKTWVCYEGPNDTTAYRAASRQTCPVASSASVTTWQHYKYDGLGRTIREQRLQPGPAVEKRFTLFDAAGNAYFASEWVTDATSETVAQDLATSCAFSGGTFTGRGRPSGAPGTFRLCFDPFGRAQQVVGPRMSSLMVVDRTDGTGNTYSDTKEAATTYCVNATFSNPTTPTCSAGGINAVTTTQKDAFGRILKVTEPSNDATNYAYDVNGKLTSVTQGAQVRSYVYDDNGFLRQETPREKGTIYYDAIGSLGNVITERQPDGLVVSRTYDFAGRLAEEDGPAGTKYVVNCYDGDATCIDGKPGFAGGTYPGGKLTRRYGYNWIPLIGPTVDEKFTYSDAGGRLSQLVTVAGNGDLGGDGSPFGTTDQTMTQGWTYSSLGLVHQHNHPRNSGSFPVTYTYANGLPTQVTGNLSSVVTAASYNPAGGLASWTAGNTGTAVVTTITQDASMLPRPSRIKAQGASTLFDTGTYSYDGAGNILSESDATHGGTFTYDNRSRILSAAYGTAGSRSFSYDRWGNLLSNGSLAFQMDTTANNNHLKVGGSTTGVSYDLRGNLTAFNGDAMAYDALDRQYRNTNAGSDWVFLFNGAGERVVKFPGKAPVLRREMARYIAEANALAKGWTLQGCAQFFGDVPCSDPDARQIKLVYDKGITTGCATNPPQYCPDATLTRAQTAVFLVKGYKPEGFTPPACQGTFTDVTCSGPYATFAPWIEQLYRDGVTGGCSASPLQFCPGNTVGEWEMLVWLARAPGSSPGTAFWNTYHPVPRGSIYTLRDDQNRVVTEMAGGTTGSATATLSAARDNVFLGNLLVASYVASPAGWQYSASDHLGSPRVVFDQSGQLVESHRYWPYGEDANAVPPNQKLSFCLMEKDDGANRYYDHARTHDHGLGRFLSLDLVGGHPKNPQSWNRYAYTLGNPMKFLDTNGDAAASFTGLGNSSKSAMHLIGKQLGAYPGVGQSLVFPWQQVGAASEFLIRQHQLHPEQPIIISGHSRGAASSLRAARILKKAGVRVDLLLTIDPVMADYMLDPRVPSNVRLAANFYESQPRLEGTYLTADDSQTDIENRRLAGVDHGLMDDVVAADPHLVEGLIERAINRMREEVKTKTKCSGSEQGCGSN